MDQRDYVRNSFILDAQNETKEKILQYNRSASAEEKRLPVLSDWGTAFFFAALAGGIAGIYLSVTDGWFPSLLLGAGGGTALILLLFVLVRLSRRVENRQLQVGCGKYADQCRAYEAARIQTFREDIDQRCADFVDTYNNAPVQGNALSRWLVALFSTAIENAPRDQYLESIKVYLRYSVKPTSVHAAVGLENGGAEAAYDFDFYKNSLLPLTEEADPYLRSVDLAGYAKLLYLILKDELIGTPRDPGPFAYSPGQFIKSNATLASLTSLSDPYEFSSDEYYLLYQAPNPNYVPPVPLAAARRTGRR